MGRRLGRTGLELTIEACLRAIADAGLTPDDIDGVATYPGSHPAPGFTGASTPRLRDALGLRTNGSSAPPRPAASSARSWTRASQSRPVADHVVCFRSVWESTAQGASRASIYQHEGDGPAPRADVFREWTGPYGAPSASVWIAMYAQRYMHEHGLTRDSSRRSR